MSEAEKADTFTDLYHEIRGIRKRVPLNLTRELSAVHNKLQEAEMWLCEEIKKHATTEKNS